jgi:hypothetical protein
MIKKDLNESSHSESEDNNTTSKDLLKEFSNFEDELSNINHHIVVNKFMLILTYCSLKIHEMRRF